MAESTPYLVSARKYRPSNFRSVVGQKALTATLKNAIESGRLAQAYLFTGPRGVGKTSCARIFAKTINCLSPTPEGEACGHCESCVAIDKGNSFDLAELDAASNNSVNDIRALNDAVYVPAQVGRYRVFIIDEVHMLSPQAFNAFLKTLEEPPANVIFILATTEKHKVIPTILSRCQIYDFKRITIQDMVEHLQYVAEQEGIEAEPAALGVIASKADGAMRDALSLFDQVSASTRGHITYQATVENLSVLDYEYYFRLVEAFRTGDIPTALLINQEIRDKGFDALFFLNGLAGHVRDLMVAADPRTVALLETSADVARRYVEQARSVPLNWYYAAMKLLSDADLAYRTSNSKRLLVELTLIRLAQLLTPAQPPFDAVDYTPPLRTPDQPVPDASVPEPSKVNTAPPTNSQTAPRPQAPKAASAPATPAPRANSGGSLASFSIKKGSAKSNESQKEDRREPVTQEGVNEAWGRFMALNPTKHVLLTAMRNATPRQTGSETFEVTVDHPASQQAFEGEMNSLVTFIRDAVSNDHVTLSVKLAEAPEGSKTLPQKEFLQKIIEKNPVIAGAMEEMEGEVV